MNDNILKDSALWYARHGFKVFPLIPREKRPLTEHGVKDATTNEFQIAHWWSRYPDANIGLAMGDGLFDIDCDIDEDRGIDGPHSLGMWASKNGALPDTVTNLTGRGGYQLVYKVPKNVKVGNRVGLLEGVDVRGEGGYIVVPPSIHPNGHRYEWEIGPDDMPITDADGVVMKLLTTTQDDKSRLHAPETIPEGERNHTLFKEACSMRSKGFCEKAIYAAIEAENEEKCIPPISDAEVRKLIGSALKYPAGGDDTWRRQMNLLKQEETLLRQKKDLLMQSRM